MWTARTSRTRVPLKAISTLIPAILTGWTATATASLALSPRAESAVVSVVSEGGLPSERRVIYPRVGGLRAQRVVTPSGRTGWTLTTASGVPVEPVEQFLRHRFNSEASPNTLKAYAHDLKHFFTFLGEQQLDWRQVTPGDLGSFVAWLRRPAPNVLPLPGAPSARAASSVSHAQTAVFSFYEFHRLQGVELARTLDTYVRGRGASYKPFLHGIAATKQRLRPGKLAVPRRVPQALTPVQLAHIVAAQARLRDRLLFALLLDTGVRIGEALGLRHEDVEIAERHVTIVPRDNDNRARAKAGRSRTIPASPELMRLCRLLAR